MYFFIRIKKDFDNLRFPIYCIPSVLCLEGLNTTVLSILKHIWKTLKHILWKFVFFFAVFYESVGRIIPKINSLKTKQLFAFIEIGRIFLQCFCAKTNTQTAMKKWIDGFEHPNKANWMLWRFNAALDDNRKNFQIKFSLNFTRNTVYCILYLLSFEFILLFIGLIRHA